jgi:hypothetical protein
VAIWQKQYSGLQFLCFIDALSYILYRQNKQVD